MLYLPFNNVSFMWGQFLVFLGCFFFKFYWHNLQQWGWTITKQLIKCLAQGHNTVSLSVVSLITELQISFRFYCVIMQPCYPRLCTCKNNCIFFFTPHFLWLHMIMSAMFSCQWSHREFVCIFIHSYRLPFFEYQTSGLSYLWSKSRPLNAICHSDRLSIAIPQNTWLVANTLFIKLE